ncbi:hypothetical protein PGTUg99_014700 [Puccinia graminis f. sp. tritici]|uniref:Uncharacterized protein n=1 Tax=Puccinia graminis f. sp. tritici TaxID=56615 RepID=A0A5B0SDB2_PUCGR|nr:hypothetical protein PGTUg99_014700 [Puccinia graminis f. sp. tritici]
MHGDNPAANAYGHMELGGDLGSLIADLGPGQPNDVGPASERPPEDEEAQRLRDRRGIAGLTAEELALDCLDEEDLGCSPSGVLTNQTHPTTGGSPGRVRTSGAALFDGIPRTPSVAMGSGGSGSTTGPAHPSTPTVAPTPAVPPTPTVPPTATVTPTPTVPTDVIPMAKPPPAGPHPARRRGRTEVTKHEDSSAGALLVMLQKSHDWQDQLRLEDRQVAEKKAEAKDLVRLEAMAEAAHDRTIRDGQLKIDRDLAEKWNQLMDNKFRAREADRKEERRLDKEWRAAEGRRYEASQKQLAANRKDQDDARRAQEQSTQVTGLWALVPARHSSGVHNHKAATDQCELIVLLPTRPTDELCNQPSSIMSPNVSDDQSIPDSDLSATTSLTAEVRHLKEIHGIGDCPSNARANDWIAYRRNSMRREWVSRRFGRSEAVPASVPTDDGNSQPQPPDGSTDAPSVPGPQAPENSLNLSTSTHTGSSTLHSRTTPNGSVASYPEDDFTALGRSASGGSSAEANGLLEAPASAGGSSAVANGAIEDPSDEARLRCSNAIRMLFYNGF